MQQDPLRPSTAAGLFTAITRASAGVAYATFPRAPDEAEEEVVSEYTLTLNRGPGVTRQQDIDTEPRAEHRPVHRGVGHLPKRQFIEDGEGKEGHDLAFLQPIPI
jgi:hypothetical protein